VNFRLYPKPVATRTFLLEFDSRARPAPPATGWWPACCNRRRSNLLNPAASAKLADGVRALAGQRQRGLARSLCTRTPCRYPVEGEAETQCGKTVEEFTRVSGHAASGSGGEGFGTLSELAPVLESTAAPVVHEQFRRLLCPL